MELPSRVEDYLAYMVGESVDLPSPRSRVEYYLRYICENGIESGGGVLVCLVDGSDSMPTTRSDGSPLQNEDYVKPKTTATFPFTINGVTFESRFSKAIYFNGEWVVDAGLIQDTSETPVKNITSESLSKTQKFQDGVNKEFATTIGQSQTIKVDTCKTLIECVNWLYDHGLKDIKMEMDYSGTTDKLKLTAKDQKDKTVVDVALDFTDKLVLEKKVQEIKNKTINADLNTIKELEVDNFKKDVVRKVVREKGTADDISLPTEKAVRDLTIDSTTFELDDSGVKDAIKLIVKNVLGVKIIDKKIDIDKVIIRVDSLPTTGINTARFYLLQKDVGTYSSGLYYPTKKSDGTYEWTKISSEERGGILVATVNKNSEMPTKRPDSSALQNEDYIKPEATAEFPFTLNGLIFNNKFARGIYYNGAWYIDPGMIQDTSETPVADKTKESISQTSKSQDAINIENANIIGIKKALAVKDKKTIIEAINYLQSKKANKVKIKETSSNEFYLEVLDEDDNVLFTSDKTAKYVPKTTKIATIDLQDDITKEELEAALKEVAVEYKNKTINADNNTITELEVDNFKENVIRDTVRSKTSADDISLPTEKAVRKELIDETTFELDETGTKDALKLEVKNVNGDKIINEQIDIDKVIIRVTTLPTTGINKSRFYLLTQNSGSYKAGLYYPNVKADSSIEWKMVGKDTVYIQKATNYITINGKTYPTLQGNINFAGDCYNNFVEGKNVLITLDDGRYFEVMSAIKIDNTHYTIEYICDGYQIKTGRDGATTFANYDKIDGVEYVIVANDTDKIVGELTVKVPEFDKYESIKNALDNGKLVKLHCSADSSDCVVTMTQTTSDGLTSFSYIWNNILVKCNYLEDATDWVVTATPLGGSAEGCPVIDLGTGSSGTLTDEQLLLIKKQIPGTVIKLSSFFYHFFQTGENVYKFKTIHKSNDAGIIAAYTVSVNIDTKEWKQEKELVGGLTYLNIPTGTKVDDYHFTGTLTDDEVNLLQKGSFDVVLNRSGYAYNMYYNKNGILKYRSLYVANDATAPIRIEVDTAAKTWTYTYNYLPHAAGAPVDLGNTIPTSDQKITLTNAQISAIKAGGVNSKVELKSWICDCSSHYFVGTKEYYRYEYDDMPTFGQVYCNLTDKYFTVVKWSGVSQENVDYSIDLAKADYYKKSDLDNAFATYMGNKIFKHGNFNFTGCRIIANAGTPKSGFKIANMDSHYPLVMLVRDGNVWIAYHTAWKWHTTRLVGSGTIPDPTLNGSGELEFAAGSGYYNLAVTAYIINT